MLLGRWYGDTAAVTDVVVGIVVFISDTSPIRSLPLELLVAPVVPVLEPALLRRRAWLFAVGVDGAGTTLPLLVCLRRCRK